MTKRLCDMADAFELHPTILLVYLQGVGADFGDCWPLVTDEWIETVRQRYWTDIGGRGAAADSVESVSSQATIGLSQEAESVLHKLVRKGCWAKKRVSLDTLRNKFCRKVARVEEALAELVTLGYVVSYGRQGPYSLDPDKKADIELAVKSLS